MKFKNLFISLGLVLSVGAGIGTALSAKENVKEAEAAVGNVYLLDTSYSTPTVWAWKSDKSSTNVNKSWPGDGMTANGGGAGVWSYSLNDDTVGFLFSDNGSNQTDDLTYNSTYNYFYHRAGFWSNSASVTNGYYFVGGTTDWKIQSSYKMNVSNGKASYTADFSVGDEFKIVNVTLGTGTNWYGYNSVTGTGSSFFVDNEGTSGNNLHCKLAGNYTISFNVSTHAFEITDNTSISTYSYVLTTNSDYNCAYIYNSNIEEYSDWEHTPGLGDVGGGHAYNIKVGFGGNNYFGLYRISDRYLNGYSYLILKKDGNVTGKYSTPSPAA